MTLFVRERHGLRMTAEGERLYRAVQGALAQIQDAVDAPAQRDDARVTVTSTMAFCSLWLVPRLGDFNRRWPEVDLRVAANDRILNLERERIDVSVRYCRAESAPSDAQWLFDEELIPVCAPTLLARGRALRRPEDLRHYTLLHIDDRDNPSGWLAWSNAHGLFALPVKHRIHVHLHRFTLLYRLRSTARDCPDDQQRFLALHHFARQRQVRRVVRQIALACEEADQRPPAHRRRIANRPAQHWIARLQPVQHAGDRRLCECVELNFALHSRQRAQMRRQQHADHGKACTSTDSTGGRSRTIAVQRSPASADP